MSVRDATEDRTTALPGQRPSLTDSKPQGAVPHLTPRERAGRGLAARTTVPPGDHAELVLPADRPDPVAVMEEQARTRVPELVPVRHGRMMVSPFTFYRGNAKGMAIDLAASPISGLRVQMCGDAHLSNFGVFASPERRLLFDVNDFDETLPGPWEWDVKRLAASIVVAGRGNGFTRKERRKIVVAAVRRYRDAMAEFAGMPTLEVWYARAEVDEVRAVAESRLSARRKKNLDKTLAKARSSDSLKAFGKLTETVDGQVRIKSDPPLLVPVAELFADRGPRRSRRRDQGAVEPLPPHAAERPTCALRPVRVRRPGAQGGRGGQRRDPLLDRADARSRRDRPAVPAGRRRPRPPS